MKRAFKYAILPTEEQAFLINKTVGCARFVYNSLLTDYKEQLHKGEKPVFKEVTFFKKDYEFLKEVDSLALANAKQNLRSAIDNFFKSKKGLRKGKKIRFPKIHKKSKSKLRYTTNNQNGTIRLEGDRLKLPKIGFVNIILHRPLEGNITSCTIEQTRDGKYYASISVEVDNYKTIIKHKSFYDLKVIGIDMSFSSFAVDSDGVSDNTKSKYVRHYRTNEERRARLNRGLSRKVKGSSNREKARKKLSKLDRHIANCRKDFAHKLSRFYADNYDVIVLEDINLQDMSKGKKKMRFGKSVNDLGFGMFKSFLSYKCEENDSLVLYADKWFASSKTCHECGSKNEHLQLSDREWVCPTCGHVIDRDLNAALNLRDYFFKVVLESLYNTVGTTGIHALGDGASTLREALMQASSLNREAPSFRWG